MTNPKVLGTWQFSTGGVFASARELAGGKDALSAATAGVTAVELDESVTSAGCGGLPNCHGILQLDAAVMTGDGRVGAVMALERCRAAAPVAEAVLHHSRHSALAGDGATAFAKSRGFHVHDNDSLLSAHAHKRFLEHLVSNKTSYDGHAETQHETADGTKPPPEMSHTDTVGIITLDRNGRMAAGCATSGMQFKDAGRIGDSPLVGCGLFVDESGGAAVASGDGDQMIRYCLCATAVELMRGGASAQEACDILMRRVYSADPRCQAAMCAMTPDGNSGMSCTRRGFYVVEWEYSATNDHVQPRVMEAPSVCNEAKWKHTCV